MMIDDDDCDPDLLAVGIRAPKLTQRQLNENRNKAIPMKPAGGGFYAPKFGKKIDGDPKKRQEYYTDNYERRARVGLGRGTATRKKRS